MKINKLYSFSLIASIVFLSAFTQADKKLTYSLKFKIGGLKAKDSVFLANYFGDKQYLKDTAIANAKGEFAFEGTEKLPGGIYLVVLPGKQYFEIIVSGQPSTSTTAKPGTGMETFFIETDTKDYTKNMKVTGSEENKKFYEYLGFVVDKGKKAEEVKKVIEKTKDEDSLKKIREQFIEIEKSVIHFRKDFIKNNPNLLVAKIFKAMTELEVSEIPPIPTLPNGRPDSTFQFRYYKAHYWDNIDLNDDRIIRTPVFHGKLEKYIKQLTVQVPDSINKEADLLIGKIKDRKNELFKYIVWYITNQYETSQIMGMDAVFVHMAENYYLTGQAYWIDETVENKIRDRYNTLKYLLLGKLAPPLSMPDTSGKYKSFSSLKSRYTVMFFWDPNCGHCQKEAPKLRDLLIANKSKYNFDVFGICTETDLNALKNFIKNNNIPWTNVYDPKFETNFKKIYDIYSTPVIYILDENKKIIAKRIAVEQLGDFFENYNKIHPKDLY